MNRQRSASANRMHTPIDTHTPVIRTGNNRKPIDNDSENSRSKDDRHRPAIVTSGRCNSTRGGSPCKHSVYLEDLCRRCGNQKIEICSEAPTSYDRRSKGAKGTPQPQQPPTSIANDDDTPRQWPLNTRRLGCNEDLKMTGRVCFLSIV